MTWTSHGPGFGSPGDGHPPGLLDRLIPPDQRATSEGLRRGRLFLLFDLILAFASLFFAMSTANSDAPVPEMSAVLGIGGVLALFNVPLLWVIGQALVSQLVCIEHVVIIGTTAYFGAGVLDPSLWWLVPASIVATFLIGPAAGAMSATAVIAIEIALYALATLGHVPRSAPVDAAEYGMLGSVTVQAGIASMVISYEVYRRRTLAMIEETMRDLQTANEGLMRTSKALADARDAALEESRRKTAFLRDMHAFSAAQTTALERTRASTASLSSTVRAIAMSVDTLAETTAASDTNVGDVARASARVRDSVTEAIGIVTENEAALAELTRSVESVQGSLDALRSAADENARAMLATERSAATVASGAMRTAALSDAMIVDAERGHEAVLRALGGMETVRGTSLEARSVMQELSANMEQVGRILTVIDEVAAETAVLALNASIIAAQAGERGRGFAVVADQIKALAGRVASSTRESARVIDEVQTRSRQAMDTISDGADAVDKGVSISREAAMALEQIVRSAREATAMARHIEEAAAEQAARAKDVGVALGGVLSHLATATAAAEQHGSSAERMQDSLSRLRRIAPDLERDTRTQGGAVQNLKQAMGQIAEMTRRIADVQGEQTHESEAALRAMEDLQRAQRNGERALASLDVTATGSEPPRPAPRPSLLPTPASSSSLSSTLPASTLSSRSMIPGPASASSVSGDATSIPPRASGA